MKLPLVLHTMETYQDEAVPVDPTAFSKCAYSPFLHRDDVVIKIDSKNEDVCNKFSPFQKALWVVDETRPKNNADETEEQCIDRRTMHYWLRLLQKYPKIKFRDIYFESEHGLSNNTMGKAMLDIADVLGLTVAPHEVHTNVHVTDTMAEKQKLAKSGHRKKLKQKRMSFIEML